MARAFIALVSGGLPRVFSVLLLLIAVQIRPAGAVCLHCFGNIAGCTGTANCPLVTTPAANVAALASTATTAISLTALLPSRVLRAIPRSTLDMLKVLVKAKQGAATRYSMDIGCGVVLSSR